MTGWKTLIFGAALALLGFLQGVDWASIIPNDPDLVGWMTSGVGVAVMVLRFFTKSPVGTKPDQGA